MLSRCLFITSSYSRRCLRTLKFWASTCFCARSIALVTILCSMGTPSSMPRRCIRPEMRSDPKMRIKSSSSDRYKRDDFVVLDVGRFLVGGEDALVLGALDAVEAVEMEEVDELRIVHELLLPLGQPLDDLIGQRLLARHELGVAAEQNVGAAA